MSLQVERNSFISRSKEAEDLPNRHLLPRSLSDYQRCKTTEERERDLSKKSSFLWQCIDCLPDKMGGNRYVLKLRQEYDDVTPHMDLLARREAAKVKRAESYPAGELLGSEITFFSPDYPHAKTFGELGYELKAKADGLYLYLPDVESITHRWQKLRQREPTLPQLEILSHPGFAGEKTAIEAYITHDVLLSSESEYFHDSWHLLRTVIMMLTSGKDENPTYEVERLRLRKLVLSNYKVILQAERVLADGNTSLSKEQVAKAKAILSQKVDYIAASQSYDDTTELYTEDSEELAPLRGEIEQLIQDLAGARIAL